MGVLLKFQKFLMFKLITRKILPDKIYYQYCYFLLFGKPLSYKNPVGFNAKIQWLKVYNRLPELSKLTDKYEVRKYVDEIIGEKYLVPLHGIYSSTDEISWSSLPEKFVLKATHGSGWNIICKNKSEFNQRKAEIKLNRWLKTNFYSIEKEWHYKNILPRISCEKLIENKNGKLLELKVFCYHGYPEYIIAYISGGKTRNIYNKKWERINVETSFKQGNNIDKPDNLDEILALASKLSSRFIFVRVDFFLDEKSIFFGELTFTPSAGLYRFKSKESDLLFGEPLKLKTEIFKHEEIQ